MISFDRNNLPDDIPALKSMIGQLLDVIASQSARIEEQQQIIVFQSARIEEQQKVIEAQALRMTEQQKVIEAQALRITEQQKIIEAQAARIDEQQIIIAAQVLQIESQTARITSLELEVAELKRHRYGKRSESLSHGPVVKVSSPTSSALKGRRVLPENLPRQQIDHEIKDSVRICQSCGELMSEIGTISSEQLDYIPAKVVVLHHVRHKYACRKCQDKVLTAQKPAQAIDKGIATSGFLTEILVAKYGDHFPLYRQCQRFVRLGFKVSRANLSRWVILCGQLLAPIVARMIQVALLPSGHIFSDDTPIPVQSSGQCRKGRFWIYANKQEDVRCSIYDYTSTRSGSGPREFLAKFQGYLQVDAFAGYHKVLTKEWKRILVGCWAHVRRKFYDILVAQASADLACEAMSYIQALYDIERTANDQKLTGEARRLYRIDHAPQKLAVFKEWLLIQKEQVLPKSPIGKAIQYALNQWDELTVYLEQGDLEIDNNRAERAMRPIAVGRKNYLFVGNDKAGRAAAVIYSIIETCKHHHINPQDYIEYLLDVISTYPDKKIDDLLPWNYQKNAQIKLAA